MLWENKKVWLEIVWERKLFLLRVIFLSFTTGNVEFCISWNPFQTVITLKQKLWFSGDCGEWEEKLTLVPFWSPWKRQKRKGFLMFSVWSKGNIGKKTVNNFAQICLMLEVKFADKS